MMLGLLQLLKVVARNLPINVVNEQENSCIGFLFGGCGFSPPPLYLMSNQIFQKIIMYSYRQGIW